MLTFIYICNSSIQCSNIINIFKMLNLKELQLSHDVEIRWSSTFLMINKALKLKEVCNIYIYVLNY